MIGHIHQGTEINYLFIKKNRPSFPVKKICQALQVSQSGYYRWTKYPLSPRKRENLRIKERSKEIFDSHKEMAGSRMVTVDLHDDQGFSKVSRPRVAGMMKEMGLRCKAVRKFVVTTDSKHKKPVAPNLLNRNFTAHAPNVARVNDITYCAASWEEMVLPHSFYRSVFQNHFSTH